MSKNKYESRKLRLNDIGVGQKRGNGQLSGEKWLKRKTEAGV